MREEFGFALTFGQEASPERPRLRRARSIALSGKLAVVDVLARDKLGGSALTASSESFTAWCDFVLRVRMTFKRISTVSSTLDGSATSIALETALQGAVALEAG